MTMNNHPLPVQGSPGAQQVALISGQLLVQSWRCTNAQVLLAAAAATARGLALPHWLDDVLRVGVAAIEAAGTGADVARVERAVTELSSKVQEEVDAALGRLENCVITSVSESDQRMAQATDAAVTRLSQGIKDVVIGRDAALPKAVQQSVKDVAAAALQEIHRVLTASSSELRAVVNQDREAVRSSLSLLLTESHKDLSAGLHAVQASLALRDAVESERRKTSRKGLVYERAVAAAVCEIAVSAGEGSGAFVGGRAGSSGNGRAGDVEVTFRTLPAPHPKLVVEAKNRDKPLTLDQWVAELDAARVNRGATVALGVTKPDLMPTDALVVVLDARNMILGWDPDSDSDDLLRACVLLLRLAALSNNPAAHGASPQLMQRRLNELHRALAPFESITQHTEQAKTALRKIEAAAHTFRADLERRIDDLQKEIQHAHPHEEDAA